MGRRTAWWRARARRGRPSARACGAAAGAVLCAAALPGPAAAAATPGAAAASHGSGTASYSSAAASPSVAYAFAEDARTVTGAPGTTDAPLIEPGRTYRSSLPRGAKAYYRMELDVVSNAYVSATAVPRPGSVLSTSDGIRVSVQSADGRSCSRESVSFGAAHSPHPITAWGARTTSPADPVCRGAGPYYVVVERVDAADSSPGAWDLELAAATEPGLTRTGATSAPDPWDSASPAPLTGREQRRQGGAGFSRAVPVRQGVWRAAVSPGQTLFYKVPVDWGQQLSATAELGSSADGRGFAVGALSLALHNPVRARVEDAGVGYDGRQRTAALAPVPPVEYANRYAVTDRVNGMRFAGSYYLVVHLAESVAEDFGDGPFGLTLRVRVAGAAHDGPGYAGRAVPRDAFGVTAADRQAAADGGAAGDDTAMKALAAGGIGAGTLVLVVLGVWTASARRRAGVRLPVR
ncbi:hypothetical protein [Streptomyces sp. H51]|uniref:hypothetical protein n=1 Tax=Streptomyces sp. H51 TaxID=3111770 RepID=UPI002D78E3B3|nr:hypothetical protein [Streptomyces sp. H51]